MPRHEWPGVASRLPVSVVVANLLYAASAWWGFTTADDRHHIEAVVRRGVRAGLYPVDGPARQYSSWRIPMLHCFTVLDTVNITSWTNFFQTKMIMITTSVPDVIIYHSLTAWTTVILYLGYSSKTCINLQLLFSLTILLHLPFSVWYCCGVSYSLFSEHIRLMARNKLN